MFKIKRNNEKSEKNKKGEIVLRPEVTPALAEMIAKLKQDRLIKLPIRVYSIGSVFRYENPQKGRKREHTQLNADIFGIDGLEAEAEVLNGIFDLLISLNFNSKDFVLKINDRQNLDELLSKYINKGKLKDLYRLLDKKEKISKSEFQTNLKKFNLTEDLLNKELKEEPQKIKNLKNLLNTKNKIEVRYSPEITRGFDYYTGIVFELFVKNEKVSSRSILGGGRYDGLIEKYSKDKFKNTIGAVGFGMGDVVLMDCLKELTKNDYENYDIAFISSFYDATKLEKLRDNFSVAYTPSVKKLGDYYKYLEKQKVKYAVIENDNLFSIQDIKKGKSVKKDVSFSEVLKVLKKKSL